jgi:hypothetical protein
METLPTGIVPVTLTVTGSPTAFLPLSTAYPFQSDCGKIYEQYNAESGATMLAWDPIYGSYMDHKAESCLPDVVSAWWNQDSSGNVYTALGPSFVCPDAYSAVQTALVASSIQQTFCCPT